MLILNSVFLRHSVVQLQNDAVADVVADVSYVFREIQRTANAAGKSTA